MICWLNLQCIDLHNQIQVIKNGPIFQIRRGIANFICNQANKLKFAVLHISTMIGQSCMLPNFKAVCPKQAELHIFKVEKLDVYIR